MSNSRKPTVSPLWRKAVDKKVVVNGDDKTEQLHGKLDRKKLDRFDSHPGHNPDPEIRKKYNKLFPATDKNKKIDADKTETTSSGPKTP